MQLKVSLTSASHGGAKSASASGSRATPSRHPPAENAFGYIIDKAASQAVKKMALPIIDIGLIIMFISYIIIVYLIVFKKI